MNGSCSCTVGKQPETESAHPTLVFAQGTSQRRTRPHHFPEKNGTKMLPRQSPCVCLGAGAAQDKRTIP